VKLIQWKIYIAPWREVISDLVAGMPTGILIATWPLWFVG